MKAKSGASPTLEDSRSRTRHILKKQSSSKSPGKLPFTEKDRITRFAVERRLQTPFLVVDLDVIKQNYRALRSALPATQVYYAVKANPAPDVIKLLVALGSSFDVASPAEIDLVLGAGAKPGNISYGNTIKKERDIAYAFKKGANLFAFDSDAELVKLARSAPGSRVFCRILTSCDGADWPLSRKFGCEVDMAFDLLLKAKKLGLRPRGVSFHVGSQQTRLDQWDTPIRQTAELFMAVKSAGITLDLVNIGGGLPGHYRDKVAPVDSYGSVIRKTLSKYFPDRAGGPTMPQIITEPGRSLVADSGVIEAEVVLISKKGFSEDVRWVYLDIGKFGGLAETHDESIKYRIEALGRKGATGPVILAGPSCDSVDILYEKFHYQLPLSLQVGDKIRIHAAGAYTASYASVGFNGFAPLPTYCI
ncbi:type III PLP-dependent enzyme [Candidatus Kaiserbacteria bacterium]|nr:type III PLP-dependent enzyme [Candidatus Kaiserbacteria bacterium]